MISNDKHATRVLITMLLILFCSGCARGQSLLERTSLIHRHVTRDEPRPLHIHVIRVDLESDDISPAVSIRPDPDGEGDAETVLALPTVHAKQEQFIAGVNANAWGMVPPPEKGDRPLYVPGAKCDVRGWVVADGQQHSPPEKNYWSFWIDQDGQPHIGNIGKARPETRLAVGGFGGLLKEGQILPDPSEVRHPRTALGIDKEGRYLFLVVVDGRQKGYSEGMSTRELAELMAELGCWEALNLDGGGSSSMVMGTRACTPRVVNNPSDVTGPRPVPVMIGVRAKE